MTQFLSTRRAVEGGSDSWNLKARGLLQYIMTQPKFTFCPYKRLLRVTIFIWVPVLSLSLFVDNSRSMQPNPVTNKLEDLLAKEFSTKRPGGVVLVAKNDEPIFRRAFGMADVELGVPMRTDSVLATGSITKEFTAIAILKLVEEGKVELEKDVRDYLPGFPTHGQRITLEQILTHTSGLPNFVDLENFEAVSKQAHSVDELLALTKDVPLHFAPGAGYHYSDTGYILLGAVIERVSAMSYGEYIETKLFRSLGMNNTFYGDNSRIIARRAKGYSKENTRVINAPYINMNVAHAAGAVISTVDDLLRWDIALRKGLVIRKDLLERAWRQRTLANGVQTGYGFGWRICPLAGRRTIGHGGWINGFTAGTLRFPDDNLNIIVLVNNDQDNPDAGFIARRIARLILTGSSEIKSHTLTSAQRAALVGNYRINRNDNLLISEKAGSLYSQRNSRPPKTLVALSPTELAFADSDATYVHRFEMGADGRAAKVRSSLFCEPGVTGVRADSPDQ